MPLLGDGAVAQSGREHRPPPPPAEAVRLLERMRDGGAAQPHRARQAKPKKQRAKAKPRNAKRTNAKRSQARRGPRVRLINRKGCIFRVRGKTWILVRTCTPRGTIAIPNGVTLNGQNRALIVTGNLAKFDGVVVATGFGRANLRNLRIEGRAGLTGQCPDVELNQFFGVMFFQSSGTIANVTVRNIDPPGVCDAVGIAAIGRKKVNVLSSTVHNAGSFGLVLQQTVNGTVAGNTFLIATGSLPLPDGFGDGLDMVHTTKVIVRDNDFRRGGPGETLGMFSIGSIGLTVAGNRFQNLDNGVEVLGFSEVVPGSAVVRDNQMSGVTTDGIDTESMVILILRNTISAAAGSDQGIELGGNTAGAANNNTVANFACGIELDPTSTVVVGQGAQANTFVNNTQDVC